MINGFFKDFLSVILLGVVLAHVAYPDTHCYIQYVDSSGAGAHPDLQTTRKVSVEGIVLNRPGFMVDGTPNQDAPFGPGAMWQIYVQGEGNDHAGTVVWMGQCYDNVWGSGTYTNQEWLDEIFRVSHDPVTGYTFGPGDRVRVTGLLKFYNGKTNINERHNTDPANDITIELLGAAVGLPEPEVITLNDVKGEDGEFIFIPSRDYGCEYYQGRLVRINDVWFVDPNLWDKDVMMAITDGVKTFPLKLGLGWGIYPGSNNLSEPFDVIGIFDQEGPGTEGYRLWVLNYDGNGMVLTDRGYRAYNLPGDVDNSGKVDFIDFSILADNWLGCVPGTGGCGGS